MGSYSAPTFIPAFDKGLVDNTSLDLDVVIQGGRCVDFVAVLITTALWDGFVSVYAQQNDDSYKSLGGVTAAGIQGVIVQVSDMNNPDVGKTWKYPAIPKIEVDTAPTLGACTCYLIRLPGPANPLF